MKITRCLHTAILVADLARSQKFYGNLLGLSESSKRSFNFPGIWYELGDYQIHLIVRPDLAKIKPIDDKWGRNPHLSLGVDDLAYLTAKLQAAGYPIQMSASGRAAFFTQDPDGNIIEISQQNE
jgi:catechol 2,3-dioxygenase-like lactoylglutathione lyase family enzyme